MNRLRMWVFTLLAVALGLVIVRAATIARRAEAVAALDARLASAATHVAASAKSLARQASAAVAVIARDPRLGAALTAQEPPSPAPAKKGASATAAPPPARDAKAEEATLADAARQSLSAAERQFGFELPSSSVVLAGTRDSLARRGEPLPAEAEAMALLEGAISGQPRRGFVRSNGGIWYGAAAPAGDGAGVAVLVPLDESWARALATAAGADVTVSAPEVKPVSTAKQAEVPLLQAATKVAGAVDVGSPGPVAVWKGPLPLPKMPQPVEGGAPLRARAIPIEGVKNAFAIVSIPALSLDAAAVFFWRAVAVLAAVLVAGLVLGLFARSSEGPPQIPDALQAAAARIEKGDFAARVPPLAGKLGTIAAALNRAAEIAGPAQAARGAPPAIPDEWYTPGARPGATDRVVSVPLPAAPPPADPPAMAAPALAPPALPFGPAAGTGSGPAADEEAHWQQVFQDFLGTRASSGEPADGLTYEKFRQKLEANKAQLLAKYGCKTVRFQVYVKDGRAALKATPVK